MIRPLEEGGSGNGDAAQILLKGADGRTEEKRGRGEGGGEGSTPQEGAAAEIRQSFSAQNKVRSLSSRGIF